MTSSKKLITPGTEVTVCFKYPEAMGHWPAIWMLPRGLLKAQKHGLMTVRMILLNICIIMVPQILNQLFILVHQIILIIFGI